MIVYSSLGVQICSIDVLDSSYRTRKVKGVNQLTLYFSSFIVGTRSFGFIELPIGCYVTYDNQKYTLERASDFKKNHTSSYEYTLTLEGCYAKLLKYILRNPVDGRLKFTMTATPQEFVEMLVYNLNLRPTAKTWILGSYIASTQKTLSFNQTTLMAALDMMADIFETEHEIYETLTNYVVALHKVEYNKTSPLSLAYGKGNGFRPGVGRTKFDNSKPLEIIYTQGGERNINGVEYGSPTLLLPISQTIGFDGTKFEDEQGFQGSTARTYITDAEGLSIKRNDKALATYEEGSLDCSDIYPKRVGTVTSVDVIDPGSNEYDILDTGITFDYNDYLIAGENMTLIFQSGQLAGREFDVTYVHASKRFRIVPATLDGIIMPGGSTGIYIPEQGNTYAVFGIKMPPAYIKDDPTKSGASWDMFREAVKYLYDNEYPRFTFSGELDGIWAAQDWVNIGAKLLPGGYIQFSDEQFLPSPGELIRITGIKDYPNKPHYPELELSNITASVSVGTELDRRKADEVLMDSTTKKTVNYAKRRFTDVQQTLSMLQVAIDGYGAAINPITIQTLAVLVGDDSLQFRFVTPETPPDVDSGVHWDFGQTAPGKFHFGGGLTGEAMLIQHMTLGITSIAPSHDYTEYQYFYIPTPYTSATLDPAKAYYVYATVEDGAGTIVMSETPLAFVDGTQHNLLIGILNSEDAGERSFVTFYGYTELLPGRITTDRIVSPDGVSYFDMLNQAMKLGTKFQYNVGGDGKLRLIGGIVQDSGNNESPMPLDMGDYSALIVYRPGNITQYQGSTFFCDVQTTAGILPTNANYFHVYASKGADGGSALNGMLTNSSITLPATSAGVVSSFARAVGVFKLYYGGADVTESATFVKESETDCTGTISNTAGTKGAYAVTAMPTDKSSGKMTVTGTYAGVTITAIFNVSKAYAGASGLLPDDYEINASTNVLVKSVAHVFSPASVTFSFYKWVNGEKEAFSGFWKTYYSTDGTTWVALGDSGEISDYSIVVTPGATYRLIKVQMYRDEWQYYKVDEQIVAIARDGVDGKSVSIKGAVATMDDLPANPTIGDGYLITNDPGYTGHLYMYEGNGSWVDCGLIQGPEGLPGAPGANGSSLYTWIKYADSPTTGISDDPAGKSYVGLAYNKTSSAESTTYSDYAWSLIRGATGASAPLMPNRGVWEADGTYVGSATRQDCVLHSAEWYHADAAAGTFTDHVWNAAHWVAFGYSGESVATKLLLAEGGNLGNFLFHAGVMESQAQVNGVPLLRLDGTTGLLEALMGKIGNFTIEAGDIVGRDLAAARKIRLTTNSIGTLAQLLSANKYLNTTYSGGFETVVGLYNDQGEKLDDTTTVDGGFVTIPYDTTANVILGSAGASYDYPSRVTSETITERVLFYKDGALAYTRTNETSFSIAAGVYHVFYQVQVAVTLQENTSVTCTYECQPWGQYAIAYVANTTEACVGKDGLFAMFSGTSYLYYKSDFGTEVRWGNFVFRLGKYNNVDGIWKSSNGGTSFTSM